MFISIDRGRWVNLDTCAQITFAENRVTFSYGSSMPSTEWTATPEQQLDLQTILNGPPAKRGYGVPMNTYRKKKTGA